MAINDPTVVMTIDIFREDMTVFASETDYPDDSLTYWLNVATMMLRPERWNDALNLGIEMFMAHHLVLDKLNQDTAAVGGYPGLNKGVVSSQSTGGVSLSYDTSSVLEPDAGHWNYTIYGSRFIQLIKMMGAGPIQVGAGGDVPGITPWLGPLNQFTGF